MVVVAYRAFELSKARHWPTISIFNQADTGKGAHFRVAPSGRKRSRPAHGLKGEEELLGGTILAGYQLAALRLHFHLHPLFLSLSLSLSLFLSFGSCRSRAARGRADKSHPQSWRQIECM